MERVKIETDKAIEMLPEGETVHTFRNLGGMLIGADWDKKEVVAMITKFGAEFAGQQAKSMGHGLAIHDGDWLFIETKDETK